MLDLNVPQALVVLHHVQDAVCLVIAQLTLQRLAVDVLPIDRLKLHLLEQLSEVVEFNFHALVPNVLNVTVQLLYRIRVVVAAITLQLGDVVVVVGRRGVDDVLEFVLVTETA